MISLSELEKFRTWNEQYSTGFVKDFSTDRERFLPAMKRAAEKYFKILFIDRAPGTETAYVGNASGISFWCDNHHGRTEFFPRSGLTRCDCIGPQIKDCRDFTLTAKSFDGYLEFLKFVSYILKPVVVTIDDTPDTPVTFIGGDE